MVLLPGAKNHPGKVKDKGNPVKSGSLGSFPYVFRGLERQDYLTNPQVAKKDSEVYDLIMP